MIAFALQRLLQGLVVILAVGLVAFAMFRFAGDPTRLMVSEDDPLEVRQELRVQLGLNDPAPVQFVRYIWRAAHGDFGLSYRSRKPVSELIFERLPATLELVLVATFLALSIGLPLGVWTALHNGSAGAQTFQAVSLIGISVPTFVTGNMMILLFSVTFSVLPSFGRGEVVTFGSWTTGLLTLSGLKSLIMPSFTLALFQLTLMIRLVRSEMLEILRTDYIKFARARGLSDNAVHFRHALRNAMVPVVTISGMQIGSLLAFAIVTETVFQWPGMGLLLIQSIMFVDVPVMAAYLMVIAFVFVVINFTVDMIYYAIDPRLRSDIGGSRSGSA